MGKEDVDKHQVGCADSKLSKEAENSSNSRGHDESTGVLEHEAGTVLGTGAEAFSSESHFDVSVLVDVLNALLETLDIAGDAVQ